jgi:hypothetical protein
MTSGVQNQTAVAMPSASGGDPVFSKDQGAEKSTALERFRDSPTTSERIQNRSTPISQQLAQPTLTERLAENSNRSDQNGDLADSADQASSSLDTEDDPALKDGIAISEEEFSLLKKSDSTGIPAPPFSGK